MSDAAPRLSRNERLAQIRVGEGMNCEVYLANDPQLGGGRYQKRRSETMSGPSSRKRKPRLLEHRTSVQRLAKQDLVTAFEFGPRRRTPVRGIRNGARQRRFGPEI